MQSEETQIHSLTLKDFLTEEQLRQLVNHRWGFIIKAENMKYYRKGESLGYIGLAPPHSGKQSFSHAMNVYAPFSGNYMFVEPVFDYSFCNNDIYSVMFSDSQLHKAENEFGKCVTVNNLPWVCNVYPDMTTLVADDFYLFPVLQNDNFEQKRRIVWMSNRQHKETHGFSMYTDRSSVSIGFCFNNSDNRFNIWYKQGELLNKSIRKGDKLQFVLDDDNVLEFISTGSSRKYEATADEYDKKLRYAYFDITNRQIEQLTQHTVKNMRLVFADGETPLYFNPKSQYEALRLQYFTQLYATAMEQCGVSIVKDHSYFFKAPSSSSTSKEIYMTCDNKGNLSFMNNLEFGRHRRECEHKGALKAVGQYRAQQISEGLGAMGSAFRLGFLGGLFASVTDIFKKK